MISQNLALFFHGHHQECQQQLLEMPQITCLFVINTNTNGVNAVPRSVFQYWNSGLFYIANTKASITISGNYDAYMYSSWNTVAAQLPRRRGRSNSINKVTTHWCLINEGLAEHKECVFGGMSMSIFLPRPQPQTREPIVVALDEKAAVPPPTTRY
jgi:hypothetical protein